MKDLQNVTIIFDATIDLSKQAYEQTNELQLQFAGLMSNCMNVVFMGQISFESQGLKKITFVQPLLNSYNLTYAVRMDKVDKYSITSGWSGVIQTDIEQAQAIIGVSVSLRQGTGY